MIRPECFPIEIFEDKFILKGKRCTICGQVPRELVIDDKQQYYGQMCFTAAVMMQYFKRTGIPSVCSEDVTLPVKKELDQAIVICDNHPDCDWRGLLGQYDSHVKQTDYQKLPVTQNKKWDLNLPLKAQVSTFVSFDKLNHNEEEVLDAAILSLNKHVYYSKSIRSEIDNTTNEILELIPSENKSHLQVLIDRLLALTKTNSPPSNFGANKRVKLATKIQETDADDIFSQKPQRKVNFGLISEKSEQLLREPLPNRQRFANLIDDGTTKVVSRNQCTQTESKDEENMTLEDGITQKAPKDFGFQTMMEQPLQCLQIQDKNPFKTPNTFRDEFKSPIVSISNQGIFAGKKFEYKIKLMSASLGSFGKRKKFIGDVANRCHYDFGLCLKTSADENRNDNFNGKIGDVILNFKSFKDCLYFHQAMVKVHLIEGPPIPSIDFFFDFDARTRTLLFFNSSIPSDRTMWSIKILEHIDLRNVQLYFVKHTLENDWQINLKELNCRNDGFNKNVEMEPKSELLIITDDESILKTTDETMHGALLTHPIRSFRKYNFELKVEDFDSACIGVVQKSKIDRSNFIITFRAGYQKDCGGIFLNNQGKFMHDSQSLSGLTVAGFRKKSGAFFDCRQIVIVTYNCDEWSVSFENLTTNEKIIVPYAIEPDKIDDFYAAVFMGSKFMYFKVVQLT